ncbi:PEP-CTERM sorting domain-containing protein [Anatilimnocola sp. NA78]|uniref:PEP-CTERM sorting domain-containing protein n=1 Tax=Anatilimnocola sp. NA78 TaxID=3415683 RepID=UPI003CE47192
MRKIYLIAMLLLFGSAQSSEGAIQLEEDTPVNWIFQPVDNGAGGNFNAQDFEYFLDNDAAPAGWTYVDGNPSYPDFSYLLGGNTSVSDVLTSAYKGNNNGSEEGGFAGSYSTSFFSANEYATISYTAGDAIQRQHMFLIVKDGNSRPNLYVYDLNSLGWDGMEAINIGSADHFLFGENGSISHADIIVGGGLPELTNTPTPEPATMVIWGAGMAGLALAGMRRARRKLAAS